MTVLYPLEDGLYVNVTNQCPCACTFCIRQNGDSVKDSGSLWFTEEEPSAAQIIAAFDGFDMSQFKEIVFCGYGEPLERMDVVAEVARYVREHVKLPIRVNTNGLSDLIHGRAHTARELEGLVDVMSISLNAPDADSFLAVTNSKFGKPSYDAMLQFAADCKEIFPKVMFTVVDVISAEQIAQCQVIADEMGIPLRVRQYVDQY